MSDPLVKQYCTELYQTDAEDGFGKVGNFSVYEAADVDALLRQREEEVAQLRAAVEVIQSSRDILLNTFTLWTVDYQQGKMALREVHNLRAQLAARTAERDAFIQGGVTEDLLRKCDGFIKVGRGCVLVRDDDYAQLTQQLAASQARCAQLEDDLARCRDINNPDERPPA